MPSDLINGFSSARENSAKPRISMSVNDVRKDIKLEKSQHFIRSNFDKLAAKSRQCSQF